MEPPVVRCRQAMGTIFRISVLHPRSMYATQAADAALDELAPLESQLSRFLPGSDIWRLNRAEPGHRIVVDLATYDCLRLALTMEHDTYGAFDVAYRSKPIRPASQAITLDPTHPTVCTNTHGVQLDLGGIGKGFALDQMAQLLAQWDITVALLQASDSTVLALGAPRGRVGWPVRFGRGVHARTLLLNNAAFSGSGTAVKGSHVIDPRTGRPVERSQVWARAATAARADAFSTAFLILNENRIGECCHAQRHVNGYIEHPADGRIRKIGCVRSATIRSMPRND